MFWGQEQVCSTRGFESNFTQTFPKLQKRTKCLAKCAVSLSLTAKHNFAWAWIQYPKSVIYLDLDLLERALSPIPSLVLSPHALERHHSHSCTRLTPAQSELLHPASYSWNKSWVQYVMTKLNSTYLLNLWPDCPINLPNTWTRTVLAPRMIQPNPHLFPGKPFSLLSHRHRYNLPILLIWHSSLNMLLPIYHNRFLRVFSPWTTIKHTNCPFIDSHLRNKSRSVFPSSEVTILRNYLHHVPHCNRTSGLNEEEMKLEVNPSKSSLIRSRYWKSSKRS